MLFKPFSFYKPKVIAGAAGPAFRSDPNASDLVFATPGALFGTLGMTYAWSDVHADIKGSGTNKTVLTTSISADNTYNNFTSDGYASATDITGTTSALRKSDDTDFEFGSGDFTIESWVNKGTNTSAGRYVFSDFLKFNPPQIQLWFSLPSTGTMQIQYNDSGGGTVKTTSAQTWTSGQWYHIALSRSGSSWYMFRDGVSLLSWSDSTTLNTTNQPKYIMGHSNGGGDTVWLQDYRIYKGVGKYTGTFTPPPSMVIG